MRAEERFATLPWGRVQMLRILGVPLAIDSACCCCSGMLLLFADEGRSAKPQTRHWQLFLRKRGKKTNTKHHSWNRWLGHTTFLQANIQVVLLLRKPNQTATDLCREKGTLSTSFGHFASGHANIHLEITTFPRPNLHLNVYLSSLRCHVVFPRSWNDSAPQRPILTQRALIRLQNTRIPLHVTMNHALPLQESSSSAFTSATVPLALIELRGQRNEMRCLMAADSCDWPLKRFLFFAHWNSSNRSCAPQRKISFSKTEAHVADFR